MTQVCHRRTSCRIGGSSVSTQEIAKCTCNHKRQTHTKASSTVRTPQNYEINSNDKLLSSKDYRDLVVAYKNGAPVPFLRVARISDGCRGTQACRMDE